VRPRTLMNEENQGEEETPGTNTGTNVTDGHLEPSEKYGQ